jgi:uncharacterized protein YlxP (DUF503 family)
LRGLTSIKERRSIVRRLIADVRAQGPAFAVCEVEPGGGLHQATIRVAHLCTDPAHTASALTRLRTRLDRGNGYEVTDETMEIL